MLGDKFRFRFAKTGTLRLLSHHDLMRCLERMLRRADLPFKSTAGFHPSPRIVFALSLPLGVAGLNEVIEIEFTRSCDSEEILAKLCAQAPVGLKFTQVSIVPMKATAIPRRIVYRLLLPSDRVPVAIARCGELLAQEKVWVARLKPAPKQLNIRPYLRNLHVETSEGVFAGFNRDSFLATGALRVGGAESERSACRASLAFAALSDSAPPTQTVYDLGLNHEGISQGLAPGTTNSETTASSVLILDLWVTQTGTARVDELLKLLDLDDLLEAGAVVERATVEIRDEVSHSDPADVPPTGPAETLPLDPAAIAALVRQDEEQSAAVGWSVSPASPVVE